MTQYPPTPPPPPYGYGYGSDAYQQQADPLAPARRAGVMMFILGGMLLLCGIGCGTFAMTVPMERLLAESGVTFPQQQLPPGMSMEELMRVGYMVIAIGSFLMGVVIVVLGLFVRRGGKGAAVTSIVTMTLMLLATGLLALVSLPQMLQQPGAIIGVCFLIVPIALTIGALVMLVQAARASSAVGAMNQQYQYQMWQYQQQQQAYNQGGYAMPQQPLDAPPPPSPQPGDDTPR